MELSICGPDFVCHLGNVGFVRLMTTIIQWFADPTPAGRFLHVGLSADGLFLRVAETSLETSIVLPDDTHLLQVAYDGSVGSWTFAWADINRLIISIDSNLKQGILWVYLDLRVGGRWFVGPLRFSVS